MPPRWKTPWWLLGLAVATAAAGCGSDDARPAPAPPPPRVLEISDEWEYAGEPDWLLEAFGAVWAVKADGFLLKIDPASGDVLDTFDTGYHELPACNGAGAAQSLLWVCAGPEHLATVDPDTGAATQVAAAKRSDEGRLGYAAGLIWFIQSGTTDLVGLDEAGAVQAKVPLGMVCVDLANNESALFVLCPTDNKVVKVDAAKAAVVGTVDVAGPRQAALAEDLFVSSTAGMLQIDPESLELRHSYDEGLTGITAIDATADEVWVRRDDDTALTAIDPRTYQVTATLEGAGFTSGGDVLITEDWIWASSYDDNVVFRVAR